MNTPPIKTPSPDGESLNQRRYVTAAEGQRQLESEYIYWTGKITDHSFQASIALIAANWAVHSGANSSVISNGWAVASIVVALLAILTSLGGALWMARLHYDIFYEAERDKTRWQKRWEASERIESEWPYSDCIKTSGKWLARCKVWLPLSSGLLFVIGAVSGLTV